MGRGKRKRGGEDFVFEVWVLGKQGGGGGGDGEGMDAVFFWNMLSDFMGGN